MIDAFGKQSDEHDIVMAMLAQYRAKLQDCITPEDLNALVAQLTEAPETVKTQMRALVSKHAKYHGWHYAKKEQLFMVQP
jgi:DnaJ-domain-containing protein 1